MQILLTRSGRGREFCLPNQLPDAAAAAAGPWPTRGVARVEGVALLL